MTERTQSAIELRKERQDAAFAISLARLAARASDVRRPLAPWLQARLDAENEKLSTSTVDGSSTTEVATTEAQQQTETSATDLEDESQESAA